MIYLPQVTLISVSTRDHQAAVEALRYSTRGIKFGAVKLVSDIEPDNLYGFIKYEHVDRFETIDDWNKYLFYDLHKHVDTALCFLSHADGFIVNPEVFDVRFLSYSYIGAPWPAIPGFYLTPEGEQIRVGNSVSIRSKELMELPSKIGIPWERNPDGNYNEDTMIAVHRRKFFIDNGCTFAPLELACKFSFETAIPENAGIKPFAFHKWHDEGHHNFNYPKF